MKRFLQYIFLFSLAILLVAPMTYSLFCYQVQLKSIKKEVKKHLIQNTAKEDLVSFEFELESSIFSNLKWKHNHEFQFQNKMFDIVEADTVGNLVYYLCFPDKQETALNTKFKNQLKERFSKDKPLNQQKNRMATFLLSLYISNGSLEQEISLISFKAKYLFEEDTPSKIYLIKEGPPPQIYS